MKHLPNCVILLVSCVSIIVAQDDSQHAESSSSVEAALSQTEVMAILAKPCNSMKFKGTPFHKFVEQMLGDKVPYVIDADYLDFIGASVESPIKFETQSKKSLLSNLNAMLDPYGMEALITEDGVVYVSSAGDFCFNCTKIYQVNRSTNIDTLMNEIRTTIKPDEWWEDWGSGVMTPLPHSLLVVQTKLPVQDQIAKAFAKQLRPLHIPPRLREPEAGSTAAKLLLPTTVTFKETPLREALQHLGDMHDIAFKFDKAAIDDAETRITLNLKKASLEATLRFMLWQAQLVFVPGEEAITVTTYEAAKSRLIEKNYPLGKWADDSKAMIKLIKSIEPESWGDFGEGGKIGTFGKSLVVETTWETHRKIASLLHTLNQR